MKTFALALALMLPGMALAQGGKTMGNPTAPLRMDLFGDFTCSHCKELHEHMLPKIIADFVTPGKAYLVFHEFTLTGPGHEHSKTASLYAAAAGRVGKYMAVSDALFATQASWAVSGKVWETVAPALNAAEQKKVQALVNDPSILAEVQKDLDQGLAARVDRTPTMVLTRKGKVTLWSSWQDYGLFKSMGDLLISK
ncbi:MAG: thioredoxin domain-containing protein [Candidatus Solibacter sp.]